MCLSREHIATCLLYNVSRTPGSDMTVLLTHDHCKISVFISVFKCLRTNSLVSLVSRGPFLQGKTQIKIDLLGKKSTIKNLKTIMIICWRFYFST